jgi:predicted nucleotide-binding protein
VEYGEPWTPEQQALIDVVLDVWTKHRVWPHFQYVAGTLLRQGINDAAEVLLSFPILGKSTPTTRFYCDVWFERTLPAPADDSKVAISVAGLAKHLAGEDIALAFVAVLGHCAAQMINVPLDPLNTVDVTVTADEAAAGLPGFPRSALDRVGSVIEREHPIGVWSITPGELEDPWRVGLRRDVARYAGLTITRYLELVREDTKQPAVVGLPDRLVEELSVDHRSVFVVHGRNESLRKSMFEFLRSINLKPIEWTDAIAMTGSGSPYIGQVLDSAFANAQAVVVLLTPDEIAYLQPQFGHGEQDSETQPAAQARPNVLFEAGMALGRNADRTVLVEVGQVRPFSDVAGRHAVRLSNDVASRQELGHRLKTAGCDVDLGGTDWHTTGDFRAPDPPGGGLHLGRRVPPAAGTRPALDFDAKYLDRGSNRIGKLQVINRGTETAHDVVLTPDPEGALELMDATTIERIPGYGKAVTVDALSKNRSLGSRAKTAFDLGITAVTESGESFTQSVFMDMND